MSNWMDKKITIRLSQKDARLAKKCATKLSKREEKFVSEAEVFRRGLTMMALSADVE